MGALSACGMRCFACKRALSPGGMVALRRSEVYEIIGTKNLGSVHDGVNACVPDGAGIPRRVSLALHAILRP